MNVNRSSGPLCTVELEERFASRFYSFINVNLRLEIVDGFEHNFTVSLSFISKMIATA